MKAAQVIEKDVIIATLIGLEDPDNLGHYPFREAFIMNGTTDQYKIFWEHVQDDVDLPYVVISHMMGGRGMGKATNQSYTDTIYKIVVHTGDMANANTYANMVALLQDQCPVTTDYTGVSATTTFQETMPVFDRYQVQNTPLFVVGGLYRLMLNLGDN